MKTNVTPLRRRSQLRYLPDGITVGQWHELIAAIRALPAATADEFERRGLVPPASDLWPPALWPDDRAPF